MEYEKTYDTPVWVKVEADWYESLDGDYVILKDVDIGWTLMVRSDQPPSFIGCYQTLAQAVGSARLAYTPPLAANA